jgi:protein pelota
MRILHRDLKQGEVKVKVEHIDDLWYLSKLVEVDDRVSGKTERKIKIGGENDRNQRVSRKQVYLTVAVEKVDFHESTNVLRVKGQTVTEVEDVPKGSYHTFNVDIGCVITITKDKWTSLHLDKLDEAVAASGRKVLIVCHDREHATYGLLTSRGVEEISSVTGEVAKKRVEDQAGDDFYEHVASTLSQYDERIQPGHVVVASPSFWSDYVMPHLADDLREKAVTATCSTVGKRGLHEVVNRPELEQVLAEDRTRKEQQYIETIMHAINEEKACYGLADCREKVQIGSVERLFVSEGFMRELRDEERFGELEAVMDQVEEMSGETHIISNEEPMEKLDNLGGVAGTLRWSA